ncbi:response regulator transcription factor [Streptomyces xiaopingdaonensis]|uniref:response regulator transcription factor n=1 Tax=Streptomyces xiaopingdaonensis TaxID=1565415 RepID=UPI00030DDF71|nr:response regulator transcription factor [Streptomyces xiaopingdaonensis]
MNVLIVDDDKAAAEEMERTLSLHGHHTRRVRTGGEALDQLTGATLVLLELSLPDLKGHEVCRRIRARSCVPVITISGHTDELDRVMALHLGADDFITKPVGRHELIARIQAVFRRTAGCPEHDAGTTAHVEDAEPPAAPAPSATVIPAPTQPPTATAGELRAGPLRVNLRTRKVLLEELEIRTTRKEFDLLALLLREPGIVLERRRIMAQVWNDNWAGSTRTLDVHIGSLRAKLGSTAWIETVRGVGYRLTVPAAAMAVLPVGRPRLRLT